MSKNLPLQNQMPPVQQSEVSVADVVAEKDLALEVKDKELAEASSEIEKLKKELELSKMNSVPSVLRDDLKPLSEEVVNAFASGKPVKVRATAKGIYPNCIRRKRGDVFNVAKIEDFSTTWHELVK